MVFSIASGFVLGLSLIAAVGAQNAFILRQGLRKESVFSVCLTCALSDVILILSGIYIFSYVEQHILKITPYMVIGGALYLCVYGILSLKSAWNSNKTLVLSKNSSRQTVTNIGKCLLLTWLNPHVYLDTVILLGSISTSYGDNRHYFGLGASIASFAFFFSLGYLSKMLHPVLSTPRAWRILEFFIGVIMLALAAKLFFFGFYAR